MSGFAQIRQDFVYGVRMLAKSPGFTLAAVLSLAIGIGANAAIFTLIDSLLLKMLPVQNPSELVALTSPDQGGVSIGTSSGNRLILSTREYIALRDRLQSFSGLLATQTQTGRRSGTINGRAAGELKVRLVSENYFSLLGSPVLLGRAFTQVDGQTPGSAPYAVISYQCWQRRFAGSPAALGSNIHFGDANLTVIGVAQSKFVGEKVGDLPDAWVPLNMQPQVMPGRMWLQDDPAHPAEKVMWLGVIGRLRPGVTLQQAQANVNAVFPSVVGEEFSSISRTQPEILKQRLTLRSAATGFSDLRGDFAEPLYILMAVVALVLAIACANVANLLLARATARQKEMAVRLALGASRRRIVSQFLIESLSLAVAGGVLGCLFAVAGVQLMIRLVSRGPEPIPLNVVPDFRVLAFLVGVCLTTGFLFGLVPAWRSANVKVNSTLKEAGRGLTGAASRLSFGKLLVVAQISISLVLLIGAGWFLRTLRNLQHIDLGFAREHLILADVDLLSAGYSGKRLPVIYAELRDRLARIPGVRAVAYSQNGIFSGSESSDRVTVEGFKAAKNTDTDANFDLVSPSYFSVLGIPILLGRDIGPQDVDGAPSVCVINESFAKFYFGNTNPIGRHVTDEFPDAKKTSIIVGVTRDARDHTLRRQIGRRFYVPALQPLGDRFSPFMNFEIRAEGEPAGIIAAVRREILAINPAMPIEGIRTLDTLVGQNMRQERIIAQLSTAFSAIALLLACVGLYGVLSYAITQRTNEIGVRMALGAERAAVVRMILRETGFLLFAGLLIGIPVALGCARLIESKLYGLKAADPLTIAAALALLSSVAFFSGFLPARRASKVDPLIALRYE